MSQGFKLSHHVLVIFAFAYRDAEKQCVEIGEVGKEGGKFAVCHLYVVYGLWAAAIGVVVDLIGANLSVVFLRGFALDQRLFGAFVQIDQIAIQLHRLFMAGKERIFFDGLVFVVRFGHEPESLVVEFLGACVQHVVNVVFEHLDDAGKFDGGAVVDATLYEGIVIIFEIHSGAGD